MPDGEGPYNYWRNKPDPDSRGRWHRYSKTPSTPKTISKKSKKESLKVQQETLIYKDKYTGNTYEIPIEIEAHFLKLGILKEYMSLTIILNQVYVNLNQYIDELSDDVTTGKEKLQETLNRLETLRMDPVVGIKEYYAKKEKYGGPTHNRLSYKIEATLYATLELLSSMLGTPIFIAKAILTNTLKEMATKKYNDAENNKQENRALLIYNLLNEMFKYNSKFDYTIGGKDIINPFITALPLLTYSNYEIIIRLDNTNYPKILVLDSSIEGLLDSYSWTLIDNYWTLERNALPALNAERKGAPPFWTLLGTHKYDDFEWVEMSPHEEKYPYLFARIWKRPLGYILNWMGENPFEEEVVFEDYEIEKPEGHGRTKEKGYGGGYGQQNKEFGDWESAFK